MIRYPTNFNYLVHLSRQFSNSYYINNDTAILQSVIVDLCVPQKIICECCGRIGHKYNSCIILVPNFLPPSLIRNLSQFNALHGDEATVPPIKWNSQPTAVHFKSWTFLPKISSVVLDIVGIFNHNYVDNCGSEFYPSEYL